MSELAEGGVREPGTSPTSAVWAHPVIPPWRSRAQHAGGRRNIDGDGTGRSSGEEGLSPIDREVIDVISGVVASERRLLRGLAPATSAGQRTGHNRRGMARGSPRPGRATACPRPAATTRNEGGWSRARRRGGTEGYCVEWQLEPEADADADAPTRDGAGRRPAADHSNEMHLAPPHLSNPMCALRSWRRDSSKWRASWN